MRIELKNIDSTFRFNSNCIFFQEKQNKDTTRKRKKIGVKKSKDRFLKNQSKQNIIWYNRCDYHRFLIRHEPVELQVIDTP